MKVLHICTFDTGGAAKAVIRLHKGLLQKGIESKILCLRKTNKAPETYEYNKRRKLNFLEKLINKIGYPILKESRNQRLLSELAGEYEIFTFPETDIDILKSKLVQDAHIIHLHWVGYFLDYRRFFKKINKPVIWTLHDKNPALGGFHLQLDKIHNPSILYLEKKLQNQKAKWINKTKNLTIVSPSIELLNFSKNSKAFSLFPHFKISNGLDTNFFKDHEMKDARMHFQLPMDKKIVLFFNVGTYHKGGDMVVNCIKNTNFKNLHFVSLGTNNKIDSELVSNIDTIIDEESLSYLYAASDLFILPSREDNLPNMMLESLACGTPVLGTPVGGIKEVIKNGINGFISENVEWQSIQDILINFDKGHYDFNRISIRQSAMKMFSLPVLAENYIELYKSKLIS